MAKFLVIQHREGRTGVPVAVVECQIETQLQIGLLRYRTKDYSYSHHPVPPEFGSMEEFRACIETALNGPGEERGLELCGLAIIVQSAKQ